jgi:hypothetical protein
MVLCFMTCSLWMHEKVNCEVIKYLSIHNNTNLPITIIYERPKELLYGKMQYVVDTNELVFNNDTLLLNSGLSCRLLHVWR